VVVGTPLVRAAEPLSGSSEDPASQLVKRYLVTGPAFGGLTALVTPAAAADPIIIRRNADESDADTADSGGAGGAETIIGGFGNTPANFVAFTVGDFSAADSVFDLTLTATAPVYTPTSGTLAYADACVGGTQLMTGADDSLSATQTLPAMFATFPFFGTATTGQIKIASNGWFTFNTATTTSTGNNTALPDSASPNALVAPYFEDLVGIRVCTKANAAGDAFTIQWTGRLYDVATEIAQFQAVLHANGVIDFIYGPNHTLNGSEIDTFFDVAGATVGLENAAGTSAIPLQFNQTGILPSTSRTLTPL
jgi:hypothetical protein